jgi:hypothetical protein
MSTRIVCLLAATVLAFASCMPKLNPAQPEASFAPALKAGASWTNTVSVAQTIVQELSGRAVETKQDLSTRYRFTVLGRGEGGALAMEASYEYLKLDIKSPVGSLSFDSCDSVDPASPLSPMGALIGGRFTFKLGADLEVSEVGGLSELAAKTAAAAKDPALAATASAFLNEASIRQSLESLFGLFPATKVASGESWTSSFSLGSGVSVSTKSKLIATKVLGDRVSAKLEGEIESAGDGGVHELHGSLSGTVELDVASLRLLGGDMSQSLAGRVTVGGASIPIKVASRIRYE